MMTKAKSYSESSLYLRTRLKGVCMVCGVTYDTVALDNVSETDANDTLEYMLCCQSGEFLSD